MSGVDQLDGLPALPFESSADWRRWLEENHEAGEGVWVRIAKKSSGIGSVTFSEALDGALCFGWIDNMKKGYDEDWYLLRFTPRRKGDNWSEINRKRVERLTVDGLMRPAGIRQVELAKEEGRYGQDQSGGAGRAE